MNFLEKKTMVQYTFFKIVLVQSTLFTTTLFVPKLFDVKLNFFCNEFKFKLNKYICANTIDVVKSFAVIKNVAVKSFHCIFIESYPSL